MLIGKYDNKKFIAVDDKDIHNFVKLYEVALGYYKASKEEIDKFKNDFEYIQACIKEDAD